MTDIQTHAPGCWYWGPAHYKCALRELERNEDMLQEALKALKDIRNLSSINFATNPDSFAITVLLADIRHIADTALAKENKHGSKTNAIERMRARWELIDEGE